MMNAKLGSAAVLLVGVAIGAAAVQGLHAQAKPPAYAVAEIEVTDAAGYKTYLDANTIGVAAAGGKFIARGSNIVTVAGTPPQRAAIIAWDNADQAQAYFTSETYKALIPNRDKSSKFTAYIVEGAAK